MLGSTLSLSFNELQLCHQHHNHLKEVGPSQVICMTASFPKLVTLMSSTQWFPGYDVFLLIFDHEVPGGWKLLLDTSVVLVHLLLLYQTTKSFVVAVVPVFVSVSWVLILFHPHIPLSDFNSHWGQRGFYPVGKLRVF